MSSYIYDEKNEKSEDSRSMVEKGNVYSPTKNKSKSLENINFSKGN